MFSTSLLYQLSLTLVPHIGPVQAKILLQHLDAEGIFNASKRDLERIEGIGSVRATSIKSFSGFSEAEEEIKFIEKYKVTPLFITDPQYPRRLLNCYDSPTLLFYKGEADLNVSRTVAIIGTRNHSEYGKQVTEKWMKELAAQQTMVISGLAFGIDAIAHKSALKNQLSTVGVLAHGLDQVYPPEHSGLAKDMIRHGGGLLTEFRSHSIPDKHNFPIRNRIVAGMSDAVIVIETGIRGGSMITAELANSYNKDVFALPGKITDSKSEGCNYLIKNNKAILLTDVQQLIEAMNWTEPKKKGVTVSQKQLFVELTAEERIVVEILKEKGLVPIDEVNIRSGLSNSKVAATILDLELRNLVVSLPGKLYQLA